MAAEKLVTLGLTPWVYDQPQKFEPFWFEKEDGNELRYLIRQQMPYISAIGVIYFIFIWFGPSWMKGRKAFNLQIPLFIWNALLAAFSIFGVTRLLPAFLDVLRRPNGIHTSICSATNIQYAETFWGYLYCLSKIVELGDTVFIVLRKKQLLFLHWFHHLTMLLMTPYLFAEGEPFSRYIGSINMGVHSIMYTYFAIKALNVRLPKWISMMLTGTQLLQFTVIILVNVYTFYVMANGGECFRTISSMRAGTLLVVAYFVLFLRFFINSYILTPKRKTD